MKRDNGRKSSRSIPALPIFAGTETLSLAGNAPARHTGARASRCAVRVGASPPTEIVAYDRDPSR